MNSNDVDWAFPVLGFTPDLEMWGFPDLDRLTRCGPRTLKDNAQDGMELVDAKGRRWRVLSIRRTGRSGSWLDLLLIFGPPQSRVEQKVEPLAEISLAEVQRRACVSMEPSRIDYYGDEGEAEYASMLRKIGRTKSIRNIYDLLNPDTFESN